MVSCSDRPTQKDLIGYWSSEFEAKVPNPQYIDVCGISLTFDDSIELKGTMSISWEMKSSSEFDSFKTSLGRYEIPFIYKIEGDEVFIEGSGIHQSTFGYYDTDVVKLKFKYKNGELIAENVNLPCESSSVKPQNFTLKKL